MSKQPKMLRVEGFNNPYVFRQDYDGMPVYTVTSPFIVPHHEIIWALFGMIVIVLTMVLTQEFTQWVPKTWRASVLVIGMFIGIASIFISYLRSPREVRLDSRDLSMKVVGKRYYLADIGNFSAEPHPRARSPRTEKFRHTVSVLAHSGPLGVNKIMLAEVPNNDEHGDAAAIRNAVDWCGREVWDAHRKAGETHMQDETTEKPKGEGDWPLSG
jgi:hypothetical protein